MGGMSQTDVWVADAARLSLFLATGTVLPRYTLMVGVSDESDTIPRGPGSLLTPEDRGHCMDSRGVRP